MNNKIIRRIFNISLMFVLTLTLFLTTITFAWFANTIQSTNNIIGFRSEIISPIETDYYVFNSLDDDSENPNVWTSGTLTTIGETSFKQSILNIESTTGNMIDSSATMFDFTLKSMQLGTVDNLGFVKDDNKFYLRFHINPLNTGDTSKLIHGDTIKLNVGFDNSSTVLIQKNGRLIVTDKEAVTSGGEIITPEVTINNKLYEYNKENPLLSFEYALTNNKNLYPGSSTSGFDDLVFNPIGLDESNTDEAVAPLFETASIDLLNITSSSGLTSNTDVYLFLLIKPNLDSLKGIVKDLYEFMDCGLLFNAFINLEIYERPSTSN